MSKCRLIVSLLFIFLGLGFHTIQAQDSGSASPVSARIQRAYSQRETFHRATVFQEQKSPLARELDQKISRGVQVTIDAVQTRSLFSARPGFLALQVPAPDGSDVTLDLAAVEPAAAGFTVTNETGTPEPYTPGVHYRGIIRGENHSLVAISIFEDEIMGTYSSEELGTVNIAPTETDRGKYLIYSEKDLLIEHPFTCEAIEPDDFKSQIEQIMHESPSTDRDVRCIKVYIEGDFALHNNKGGVAGATNYLTGLFNNVATLYENESIPIAISQILIWTTQDSYSTTSSSTALNQFKAQRPTFNGDLAHLAALGGNNLGGVAWVNAMCSNFKYAYSNISSTYQNVPTYSWSVMVFSHEMGHNVVSPHTHSCSWPGGAIDNCYTPEGSCAPGPAPTNGGTIMSYCHLTNYGINLNNGFGTLPGNLMRSRFNAVTCLGTCSDDGGEVTCAVPGNLAAGNITQTSAVVSWGAVSGAVSYNLQWKLASATNWTTVNTTATSRTLTGLTANTAYNFRVQTLCSGNQSSAYSATSTFTTSGSTSCATPGNVTVSNIATTTATISWSAVSGAVNYTLQVKTASSSTWTSFTTTGTSLNISNMTANTAYNYRVRTNCSGEASSAYSNTGTFTTLPNGGACAVPTGLNAGSITQTGAVLTWSAVTGALSYNLRWKLTSSGTWTTVNTTATSRTLTGLSSGVAYEFQVQSVCSSQSSAYSGSSTFTTLPVNNSCGTPSNVTAGSITQNSAVITWSGVVGAISYNLQWKLASASNWTTVNKTVTTHTLTGLSANTAYNYRVQAVCQSQSSAYSATGTFTTASAAACNAPGNVMVSNITSSGATVVWASVAGAASYYIEWKPSTGTTWSIGTTTGTTFILPQLSPSTLYNVRLKTLCSSGSTSAYSNTVNFTTAAGGNGSYCTSKGTSAASEWVSRVKLSGVNRVSTSDGGYINTNLTANVVPGQTYSLQFSVGKVVGNFNIQYFRIWIDYNRDGDFLDAGETVVSLATSSTVAQNFNLVIPSSASLGTTRMRVSVKRGAYASACETFPNGEVEDYNIQITSSGNLPVAGDIAPAALELSGYPNPVSDVLTLNIFHAEAARAQVQVYDMLGRLVRREEQELNGGDSQIGLNTSEFAPGLYEVQVLQNKRRASLKIVKQ